MQNFFSSRRMCIQLLSIDRNSGLRAFEHEGASLCLHRVCRGLLQVQSCETGELSVSQFDVSRHSPGATSDRRFDF